MPEVKCEGFTFAGIRALEDYLKSSMPEMIADVVISIIAELEVTLREACDKFMERTNGKPTDDELMSFEVCRSAVDLKLLELKQKWVG